MKKLTVFFYRFVQQAVPASNCCSGVKGFPKIKKLVNMIPAIPDKKISIWLKCGQDTPGGSLFRLRAGYTSIPGLPLGKTKEKLLISVVLMLLWANHESARLVNHCEHLLDDFLTILQWFCRVWYAIRALWPISAIMYTTTRYPFNHLRKFRVWMSKNDLQTPLNGVTKAEVADLRYLFWDPLQRQNHQILAIWNIFGSLFCNWTKLFS